MNIETQLHERITKDFEKLDNMEVGTDEYKNTADSLTKFMDRAIEIEKIHVDDNDKVERRADEQRDRLIKNIITGVSAVGQIALIVWGTKVCLKFEETGTITTGAGRKFTNSLFSWLR